MLMKKTLLFAVLTALTVTASAQREEPVFSGSTVAFTPNDTVYLLHVESNLFYGYGNDWDTHVTVAKEGIPVTFQVVSAADEDPVVYQIRDYHPVKKNWYYAFFTTTTDANEVSTYHWYTDGAAEQPDRYYSVEATENSTFRIFASDDKNEMMNHMGDMEDFYLTLDPDYVDAYHDGVTTGTGVVYASASLLPQNEWKAVSQEEYAVYMEQRRVFARAQELLALIEEGNELGVDTEAAQAAYEDLTLTYDQIDAAIAALMQLFTAYYEENVTPDNTIDMTRYVVNPSFENGLTGWTDEMGLSTFENGNWDAMIDGTVYTGSSYLNVWNGSGVTGRIYQKVTGLPNGVYGITIGAHSDAVGGFVFGGDFKTPVAQGYYSDEQKARDYTVVALVTDGTLDLGYRSEHEGSFWSTMDNVRLLYYGAGQDAYASWVEQSIAQAHDFTDAWCQPTLLETYNQALAALQDAELDENLMTYVKAYLEALNAVNRNVKIYESLQSYINWTVEVAEDNAFYPTYTPLLQRYVTETAQPVLDAHALSTEDVEAVIAEITRIINEGYRTLDLIVELTELNDYMKTCLETYATTSSEESRKVATTLAAEIDELIVSDEIENNEQILELEARIQAAIHELRVPVVEASDDNPVDYTVYLTNPGFEDGLTGWENAHNLSTFETKGNWGIDGTYLSGTAYLNLWHAAPQGAYVRQTVTGLPNGTYKLSAAAYANNSSLFVFANGDNVAVPAYNDISGVARYEVITKVTDGTLKFGVILHSDGDLWCTVDNFELTCYGANSQQEVSGDAFGAIAPDAILAVSAQPSQPNAQIFNLAGQRVKKTTTGLYIVGGRKIFVK